MEFSRVLGDSELSYFLPSRADGVNDMYLHLGFRAPPSLVNTARVHAAWAILRRRHPLLAARVDMKPAAYADARFVYSPPASPEAALADAAAAFDTHTGTKDGLIDAYLNGPRTLSPTRLSHLILSTPPPRTPPADPTTDGPPDADSPRELDLLLCAVHFLGDGMALHACANEFFLLLTSQPLPDLPAVLATECAAPFPAALPSTLEARLPPPRHAWQRAAHALEFRASQARLIGGHAFARALNPAPRRTVVPTVSFTPTETRAALAACKAHGVSIAHAMFALCNVAWARRGAISRPELPMLMYSALNLRPHLVPPPPAAAQHPSYWFLAVGYFNVVLPAFLPRAHTDGDDNHARTFWARARAAKAQSVRAARSRLLVPRTRCMAEERGARARAFAAHDDGKILGPTTPAAPALPPTPAPTPPPRALVPARTPAPSTALLGLSLLGNLDATYAHAAYGGGTVLHTLTTGSRQRAGGLLLFAYTFAGRLWLSLGYDEAAFASGSAAAGGGGGGKDVEGAVDEWWAGVVRGVAEFLVDDGA